MDALVNLAEKRVAIHAERREIPQIEWHRGRRVERRSREGCVTWVRVRVRARVWVRVRARVKVRGRGVRMRARVRVRVKGQGEGPG